MDDVRAQVIAQFKQVAEEQNLQLAPLSDDLALIDTGLDSLCFAILVVRLEATFGIDPFSDAGTRFPATFGDFLGCYEHAAK